MVGVAATFRFIAEVYATNHFLSDLLRDSNFFAGLTLHLSVMKLSCARTKTLHAAEQRAALRHGPPGPPPALRRGLASPEAEVTYSSLDASGTRPAQASQASTTGTWNQLSHQGIDFDNNQSSYRKT